MKGEEERDSIFVEDDDEMEKASCQVFVAMPQQLYAAVQRRLQMAMPQQKRGAPLPIVLPAVAATLHWS